MKRAVAKWSTADLVEHFAFIRVDHPHEPERAVIDNIGREWIEDHFDELVELIRKGAQA